MPRQTKRETRDLKPRKSKKRDIEKVYDLDDFVDKLRRLADAIEGKKRFAIQVAGERIFVPARATYNIEHERSGEEEEIEFQIKWTAGRSV